MQPFPVFWLLAVKDNFHIEEHQRLFIQNRCVLFSEEKLLLPVQGKLVPEITTFHRFAIPCLAAGWKQSNWAGNGYKNTTFRSN